MAAGRYTRDLPGDQDGAEVLRKTFEIEASSR